jgi:hypothetical protein
MRPLHSLSAEPACNQSTPEETISGCSAVIDSGNVSGRRLKQATEMLQQVDKKL